MKNEFISNSLFRQNIQSLRQIIEMEYVRLRLYADKALNITSTADLELGEHFLEFSEKQVNNRNINLTSFQVSSHFFKHSLFISVYSYLEYILKEFSKIVSVQQDKHKRRVGDFDKAYQFYHYLINDIHIGLYTTEEYWKKLNIFKDIRNSIVHYNSSIGRNISTDSYQFISEDPRIQLDASGSFMIKDESLILELIELCQRFIIALIDDYAKKIN